MRRERSRLCARRPSRSWNGTAAWTHGGRGPSLSDRFGVTTPGPWRDPRPGQSRNRRERRAEPPPAHRSRPHPLRFPWTMRTVPSLPWKRRAPNPNPSDAARNRSRRRRASPRPPRQASRWSGRAARWKPTRGPWRTGSASPRELRSSFRWKDTERLARELAARPIDLSQPPLLRAHLLELAPERRRFVLTMPHLIAAGWSAGILFRELEIDYSARRTARGPRRTRAPARR